MPINVLLQRAHRCMQSPFECGEDQTCCETQTSWHLLAWLRRQSHYGGNDGDGGGSSHSDGYVMWRVGHTVNISKGYCKEQRENGGHRSLVDLPFFFGSAWWRLRQSQESTSQDHVCSSPPAMSAEELRITVTAVFVPSLLALPPF